MHSADASFSIRVLTIGHSDRSDLDAALAIFVRNTPPAFRTKTNEIRTKMASEDPTERKLYIAALYRGDLVIGFAMFSYLRVSRIVIIDHVVIDRDQRGMAAFFVFSQLLYDLIWNSQLEINYTIAEIESGALFGGEGTGGTKLIRLLSQVGFDEVHAKYFMPSMEARTAGARFDGVLMLHSAEKIHRMRREEFLGICKSIYDEHYLSWFSEFLNRRQLSEYKAHLDDLHRDLRSELRDTTEILINGAQSNGLIEAPPTVAKRSDEAVATIYVALFIAIVIAAAFLLYFLSVPSSLTMPILLALLLLFAGVIAVSRGRAFDVFERIITRFESTRKSRYRPTSQRRASKTIDGPEAQMRLQSSDDE
jgi:hypothetical protein